MYRFPPRLLGRASRGCYVVVQAFEHRCPSGERVSPQEHPNSDAVQSNRIDQKENASRNEEAFLKA
jgi:hypothetical protein